MWRVDLLVASTVPEGRVFEQHQGEQRQ